MWSLWLIFAVFIVIALLLLSIPLFKRYSAQTLAANEVAANERKALNVKLYQEKLSQLEQDRDNGLLDDEGLQQASLELKHILIKDIDGLDGSSATSSTRLTQLTPGSAKLITLGMLLFVPIFSVLLYSQLMPENLEQITGNAQPIDAEHAMARAGQQAPDIGAMVSKLEQKLRENPDDAQGWQMLGRSYTVLKRTDDAVNAYAKAVALDSNNTDLQLDYVEVLMQTGVIKNYNQAGKILDNILEQDPDHADALWFSGFLAFARGDTEQTKKYWQKLILLLPPGSQEHQIVLQYLAKLDSPDVPVADAVPSQNEQPPATTQQPGPAPGQQMTNSESEQAFIASMIARVEARVKQNPDDLQGWQMLGKSYMVQKRYRESANAYAKAVALDGGNNVQILMNYTEAVVQSGDQQQYNQAHQLLAELLEKNSRNADALFLTGSLYAASGNKEQARTTWTKLLTILPEGSSAALSVQGNINNL